MQSDIDKVVEAKINALKKRYLKTLQEHVNTLELLLPLCQNNALTLENREELLSNAHHLAGNGAIFGFADISELGMTLQDALRNNPSADADSFSSQLSALIAACNIALANTPLQEDMHEENAIPEIAVTEPALPVLLVVDDDENIRNIIDGLLKEDAHIVFGTGAEGVVSLIIATKPDMILLDNHMPGGSTGLEILEIIQSIQEIKDIPIIMLTASDTADNVMRGLMAGAVDYITKPFNAIELAEKIRGRLARLHNPILIADDDEAVRELLKHKFNNAGCKVVCVADGAAAWEQMQTQHFALIMLDCMMPGFDGMTILRMMKKNPAIAKTPLVFLTARHSSSDIMEGLNTGATDYICKPFNPDEVIARCIRFMKHPTSAEV